MLVVAPLQSMPDDVPAHMPVVPWQRLADVVRARQRLTEAGTSESFILDADATFLREEELMDDALTTSHALALEHHAGAEQAVSALCRLADPAVEARWGTREDQHTRYGTVRYGPGWSVTYPVRRCGIGEPPSTWRQTVLKWGLQNDGGRGQDERNMCAFVAGATMAFDDNPVAIAENAGWVNDLRDHGFAVYVYEGHYQRVWAFLYPEQLSGRPRSKARPATSRTGSSAGSKR